MPETIRTMRWMFLGLILVLGGCAGLRNGPRPIITTRDLAYVGIRDTIKDAIIADCLQVSAPVDTTQSREDRRDRLVSAYLFAVDVAYNEYERNLLDSIRENDLGATTASLALSSIGSVVGIEELARALDVTNSIVTGTHTAIGRDYLLNQTLTTLQTQMRASRNTQRAAILRRYGLPIGQWNACTALSDVLTFEQAGTLNAAIAAVAASAAQASRTADQAVASAIPTVDYATSDLAEALRTYLFPNVIDATARAAIISARSTIAVGVMNDLGIGAQGNQTDLERLGEIVEEAPFEDQRRQLIEGIIGVDPQAAAILRPAG